MPISPLGYTLLFASYPSLAHLVLVLFPTYLWYLFYVYHFEVSFVKKALATRQPKGGVKRPPSHQANSALHRIGADGTEKDSVIVSAAAQSS